MSFRLRLASLLAGKPATAGPVENVLSSQITTNSATWNEWFGAPTGLPVPTEDSVFTISAIYACVNLFAGAIASLPMHVLHVSKEGEKDRAFNDPIWWVVNEEMTPRWSAASGWEFMVQSLLLHGDAFAIIRRGPDAKVTGLEPIHPRRVEVVLNDVSDRLVYAIEPEHMMRGRAGHARRIYDQDDVLHVAGFGFNGLRGMSPLRYALRMTGAVSLATQEFSAKFFANSAQIDLALTTDKTLSNEAVESLRSQFEQRHRGYQNAFRPVVLQGGLDVKEIQMPLEDMQLVAMRQFQIEEIVRIYGVPPFMVGHNEKTTSWGTGVEAMGTGFVRFPLRQHLNKFETEFNRKLFRTASKRVEFDTFDLERADMKSMFEAFRVAIGRAGEPGWMSAREVRQRLNMKREADGELNPGTPLQTAKEPVS